MERKQSSSMSTSVDDSAESGTTTPKSTIKRNLFECLFKKVNQFYERFFSKIGTLIGTYPYIFILGSFLLTGLCSLGFLRSQMVNDTDRLFIPTDSRSMRDREIIARILPIDFNNYYLHQDIDFGIFGDVIFVARDYKNIARPIVREELERIFVLLRQINVTYHNQTYFYDDLCARREGKCVIDGDVFFHATFWQRLERKEISRYLQGDMYIDDDGSQHLLTVILGKHLKIDSQHGSLYAKALKLHFNLRRHSTDDRNVDYEKIGRMWEQAFLEFFQHFRSAIVDSIYSVSTSIDQELEKNVALDIKLVAATFALMIMVATIFLSVHGPFSQSPVYLSAIGVSATFLGLISGFGFCSLIGIPMCSLVFVTPFLTIGVGIDDMFLIHSAYRRTKITESTPQRLAATFRICGSGITITSLTDIVAFLVGATTNFYGIRLFCIYTSASIAFCYLYQIIFFGSAIALYNECLNQNRHTLFFCIVDRTQPPHNQRHRPHRRQQGLPWKEMFVCLIKPLFTRWGQGIICLIFAFYTFAAFYGASQMKDGMKLGQLLSDTSYAKHYFDTLDNEYEMYPLVQFVITEPLPYWRHDYSERIHNLVKIAKQLEGMDSQMEISWLSLLAYDTQDHPFENGTEFMDHLKGFLFLLPTLQNDVVLNGTHVLVSRFYLRFGRVFYNSSDGQLVNQLRSLADQSKLPIKVYSTLFKYYEQMNEVIPNIIQSFLIALEAMYLITLLIIPDLQSVIIVISTMGMILTGLIATLHAWSVQTSSVMMVELIMSIGFCSDFCVHIVHAFLTGTGTRKERAQQALINMGMPILCASLSSIVGVMFLGFAQSYLFRTFFKTMVSIMTLGAIHALAFLPVILSLIGSHWSCHEVIPQQQSEHIQMMTPMNTIPKTNGHTTENEIIEVPHKTTPATIEEEDELISPSNPIETEAVT